MKKAKLKKILSALLILTIMLQLMGAFICVEADQGDDVISIEIVAANNVKFKYKSAADEATYNTLYSLNASAYLSSNWGQYIFSLIGFDISTVDVSVVKSAELGIMTQSDKTYNGKVRIRGHETIDTWDKTPAQYFDVFDLRTQKPSTVVIGDFTTLNGGVYTKVDITSYLKARIAAGDKTATLSFLDQNQQFQNVYPLEAGGSVAPKLFLKVDKEKFIVNKFNSATTATFMPVMQECAGYLGIQYDEQLFREADLTNAMVGRRFATTQEIIKAITKCLDDNSIIKNRAFDSFNYTAGKQLKDTTGENNFSGGYRGSIDLSLPLTDDYVINSNGYIGKTGELQLYRGLSKSIAKGNESFYIGTNVMMSNDLHNGDYISIGMGNNLFGIKKQQDKIYPFARIGDAEHAGSEIPAKNEYGLFIKIDGNFNASFKVQYEDSKSSDDVTGVIPDDNINVYAINSNLQNTNVKFKDITVEYYKSGYADLAYEKLVAFQQSLNGDETVLLENLNELLIEIDYLYDGICKKFLNFELEQYADFIENARLKIKAKEIMTQIANAKQNLSYAEYISIGQKITELGSFEGKAALDAEYELLTQAIKACLPVIGNVKLNGEGIVGHVLSVAFDMSDPVGNGTQPKIKWYLEDKVVSNESTLEVKSDYVGKNILVSVTPANVFNILGTEIKTSSIYVSNIAEALSKINSADQSNIETRLRQYATDLKIDLNYKYNSLKSKADVHYAVLNQNFEDVSQFEAAFESAVERCMPTYDIIAQHNAKFKYKSAADEATYNLLYTLSPTEYLYSNWGVYIFSLIGFNLEGLNSDSLVSAKFQMMAVPTKVYNGTIKVRSHEQIEDWNKTPAQFFDIFDLRTTKSTTALIGDANIVNGEGKFTAIDVCDNIKSRLTNGAHSMTLSFLDNNQQMPSFYAIESGNDKAPRLTVTVDKAYELITKINSATTETLQSIIENNSNTINIDLVGGYNSVVNKSKLFEELKEKNYTSLYEFKQSFDRIVDNLILSELRVQDEFNYPSNTRLADTVSINGFSSGYKADINLTTNLSDDYVIGNDGFIQKTGEIKLYRGLSNAVTKGNRDYYLSYEVQLSQDLANGQFIGAGLENNIVGIKKIDGKLYMMSYIGNTQALYNEITGEKHYKVLIKLTNDFKVYFKVHDVSKSEPESWIYAGDILPESLEKFSIQGNAASPVKLSNVVIERYPKDYAVQTQQAYDNFVDSLDMAIEDQMEKYRIFKSKIDDLADGIVKSSFISQIAAYNDIIENLNERIKIDAAKSAIAFANGSKKYADYVQAKALLDGLKNGEQKTALEGEFDTLKKMIESMVPVISGVNVNGNWHAGATLTGSYSMTDICGNGIEPLLEWYMGNECVGQGAALYVENRYEGKTISFAVTPQNNAGTKGTETRSIAVTIAAPTSGKSDNVKRGGGSIGGIGKITPEVIETAPTPDDTKGFSDIENHWAKEEIKKLYDRGIIKGTGNGTFAPDECIKRSEFVKIIVDAFYDSSNTYNNIFEDVSQSDWYANAIQTAYENKIVSGYGNVFNPNGNITREEMAVIISKVMSESGTLQEESNPAFEDNGDISDWAKKAVDEISSYGIIKGDQNNMFMPKNPATRAEAACVINRLIAVREGK